MQKNDLIKTEGKIYRILNIHEEKFQVIDCLHRSMPKWISKDAIINGIKTTEEELLLITGAHIPKESDLNLDEKNIMRSRYELIACILPFIHDDKLRCSMTSMIAEEKNISKQTIRNYLFRFLAYNNIAALLPKKREGKSTLSDDERNMRWALNKFYFTREKHSINTAYMLMLKEKYCDKKGILIEPYPTIHQFRYFYKKHLSMQTYYISRNGITDYQRNSRPLLGNGVHDFAPTIGTGMLDSTICDIYLVNEEGNIIGRPVLTACVDAYSGLCCGYCISLEGGIYSLRNLMTNIIYDKKEWCKKFGIKIDRKIWNCNQLPSTLVTDMGPEYKSECFEQLAELGIKIINLPPYRPELKGVVEKFFDLIQGSYKKHLKGKGIVEPDFMKRGGHDYRKDACITINDFEKIILHSIIYYNSERIVENVPYTIEMLDEKVEPFSSSLWNYEIKKAGANLISVDYSDLICTMFPRTCGKFARDGLRVNKLRYKNRHFVDRFLAGGEAIVAYNPDDVSKVWVKENGRYICFELIESMFERNSVSDVLKMKSEQKEIIKDQKKKNIQAQIHLANKIETAASASTKKNVVAIQDIKKNRAKEKAKSHIAFLK